MSYVQQTLAGRYELLEVAGRGGMGAVYRARDAVLDRVVAVKVLPDERAEELRFVSRFQREARSAAALSHPHIVAVYDSGQDGDTHYIVMEYVDGSTLSRVLREQAPLPTSYAIDIAQAMAEALACAHAAGIVHRDVKPSNVMIADDGTVKVLDFGIARSLAGSSLTATATVLGTAAYLSPEQGLGEPADARSDIYSLGCVLYEMLTGRPPFTGEAAAGVIHQHVNAAPRHARELNPAIPPALDALVLGMLAKAPDARPQDARALAARLPQTRRDPDATTLADAPTTRVLRPRRPEATEPLTLAARTSGARRRRMLGVAAVILVVLGVAIAALAESSAPHHAQAATTSRRNAVRHTTVKHHAAATPAVPAAAGTSGPTGPTASGTTGGAAPGSAPASSPPSVAQAAGSLSALVLGDMESGQIDQQAEGQIVHGLADTFQSYAQGNANDTLNKMQNLQMQVAQLTEHGDIQSGAVPAITAALNGLASALNAGGASTVQPGATPPAPGAGGAGQGPAGGPGPKPPKGPKAHHGKHGFGPGDQGD